MYWKVPRIDPRGVRFCGVVGSIETPARAAVGAADFAKPKSSSFAPLRQHDVAGFQIAVHDTRTMGFIGSVSDLGPVAQRLIEWQSALSLEPS